MLVLTVNQDMWKIHLPGWDFGECKTKSVLLCTVLISQSWGHFSVFWSLGDFVQQSFRKAATSLSSGWGSMAPGAVQTMAPQALAKAMAWATVSSED